MSDIYLGVKQKMLGPRLRGKRWVIPYSTQAISCDCLFIRVEALRSSQQFLSHVETIA